MLEEAEEKLPLLWVSRDSSGTENIDDPSLLRETILSCIPAIEKAKPPLWRIPIVTDPGACYSAGQFLKDAVLDLGSDVGGAEFVDPLPPLRQAYPKLREAFQTFDQAAVSLWENVSFPRRIQAVRFASKLRNATEPVRNALGIEEDPRLSEILGRSPARVRRAELSVLQLPTIVAGDTQWRAFWQSREGDELASTLSLSHDDNTTVGLQLSSSQGQLRLWSMSQTGEPDGTRRWLVLRTQNTTDFACVPLPWFDSGTQSFATVEALVNVAPDQAKSPLQLLVRDATLGGLLAYLSRGNLGVAGAMIKALDEQNLIEETIRGKVQNPLAACAAAYVGLAIFDPHVKERWDGWLPNIMKWFPWLPDGAIVHARRIMQRPRQPSELTEALDALKEAYRRGIPYFTSGMQHMRDMLSLMARDSREARDMLEAVSSVLSRVDRYQAFTVIRFPKADFR